VNVTTAGIAVTEIGGVTVAAGTAAIGIVGVVDSAGVLQAERLIVSKMASSLHSDFFIKYIPYITLAANGEIKHPFISIR
jgi:hypothetical protein